jgi:hypothetical protein
VAQISTVTIPALVISFNNNLFVNPDNSEQVVGKVLQVPCRDIEYDNEDMWAIPVKDSGIFTGLEFQLKNGIFLDQPTFDSFTVFQIKDKLSDNQWIIYGSRETNFTASCATCCGAAAVPMPGIAGVALNIAPCEVVNLTDDNGDPYMVFGLPTLESGETYFPYGSLDNVALTSASAGGYANVAALLSFLNTNWTPYVWTADADEITLTATGGELDASLCVSVIAITPS